MRYLVAKKKWQAKGDNKGVGFFVPLPEELASQFPDLSPKDDSPTHVTFYIVGEVPKDREDDFVSSVKDLFQTFLGPVMASLSQLDYFVHPGKGRRVAFCTVNFNKRMSEWRSQLHDLCVDFGLSPQDCSPWIYNPHTMLGYLDGLDEVYRGEIPSGQWSFDHFEIWGLSKLYKIPLLLNPSYRLARKVAKRYKKKVELPSGNVQYQYGPRQVAKRQQQKAEKLEKLQSSMGKLKRKLKSDLKSDDLKTKLMALAVSLIDVTYARVGNDRSAESGHYGVTGWQVGHVKFYPKRAEISYTGKSGVKHTRKIEKPALVKELKSLCKGRGEKDGLFSDPSFRIKNTDINKYLSQFEITAKDLRGLHANREMRQTLKKIRSGGPDLPWKRKDRDKILKIEFKKALKEVAAIVGHTEATLKSHYLVPGLEKSFLKNGDVPKTLKKATKTEEEKIDEKARANVRPSPKKKPPRRDLRKNRLTVDDDDLETGKTRGEDPDLSLNYKRVASLWLITKKVAMDFHTEEEWKKYQEKHPDTDPKRHQFLWQEEDSKDDSEEEGKDKKKKKEEKPKDKGNSKKDQKKRMERVKNLLEERAKEIFEDLPESSDSSMKEVQDVFWDRLERSLKQPLFKKKMQAAKTNEDKEQILSELLAEIDGELSKEFGVPTKKDKDDGNDFLFGDDKAGSLEKTLAETFPKFKFQRDLKYVLEATLEGMNDEDIVEVQQHIKDALESKSEAPSLAEALEQVGVTPSTSKGLKEFASQLVKRVQAKQTFTDPLRLMGDGDLEEASIAQYNDFRQLGTSQRAQMADIIDDRLKNTTDSEERERLEYAMDAMVMSQVVSGEEVEHRTNPSPGYRTLAKVLERKGKSEVLLRTVSDFSGAKSRDAMRVAIREHMDIDELHEFSGGKDSPYNELFELLKAGKSKHGKISESKKEALEGVLRNMVIFDSTFKYALFYDALKFKGETKPDPDRVMEEMKATVEEDQESTSEMIERLSKGSPLDDQEEEDMGLEDFVQSGLGSALQHAVALAGDDDFDSIAKGQMQAAQEQGSQILVDTINPAPMSKDSSIVYQSFIDSDSLLSKWVAVPSKIRRNGL